MEASVSQVPYRRQWPLMATMTMATTRILRRSTTIILLIAPCHSSFFPFQANIQSTNLFSWQEKYNSQQHDCNGKLVIVVIAQTNLLLWRFALSGNIPTVGSVVSLRPSFGTRAQQPIHAIFRIIINFVNVRARVCGGTVERITRMDCLGNG